MPLREVPMVAFTAVLRGGALEVPQDRAGLASLAAGLLEGAGARDAFQFADAVAGAGGRLATAASARVDHPQRAVPGARSRKLMVGLLADAAASAPRCGRVRQSCARAGRADPRGEGQRDPVGAARRLRPRAAVRRASLRPTVDGTERTLAAVTHADLREFWDTRLGADRLTLVFAGDLGPAWLGRRCVARSARSGGSSRGAAAAAEPRRVAGRRVLLVDSPGAAQTCSGSPTSASRGGISGARRIDIVNTLYGGRFTSILNTELRIKSGLSTARARPSSAAASRAVRDQLVRADREHHARSTWRSRRSAG